MWIHRPPSLLTNRPRDAREFGERGDGAVYKATMHKLISEDGLVKLVYTTPVNPSGIDERIATTLHLFQGNVRKSYDVRVVATDAGHVHAIGIHTDDPAGRQDFRTAYDTVTYDIPGIPSDVARACRVYLKALDLALGVSTSR